jgi:hypothetical protein
MAADLHPVTNVLRRRHDGTLQSGRRFEGLRGIMKNALLSLSALGLIGLATSAYAADLPSRGPVVVQDTAVLETRWPPVIVQLGPTTPYSTINCAEFAKLPDGAWTATGSEKFGLGFVQGIIPPKRPIKSGAYIYNNIDLYSQLEEQCKGAVVQARY